MSYIYIYIVAYIPHNTCIYIYTYVHIYIYIYNHRIQQVWVRQPLGISLKKGVLTLIFPHPAKIVIPVGVFRPSEPRNPRQIHGVSIVN